MDTSLVVLMFIVSLAVSFEIGRIYKVAGGVAVAILLVTAGMVVCSAAGGTGIQAMVLGIGIFVSSILGYVVAAFVPPHEPRRRL